MNLRITSLASCIGCSLLLAISTSSYAQEPPADDLGDFPSDEDFLNSFEDDFLPDDLPPIDENLGDPLDVLPPQTNTEALDTPPVAPIFYRNGKPVEVGSPQVPPAADDTSPDFIDDDFPLDDDLDDLLDDDELPDDDSLDDNDLSPDDDFLDDDDMHGAASTTDKIKELPLMLIGGIVAGIVILFVLLIVIFKGKGKKKTQAAIEQSQVTPAISQAQDTSHRLDNAMNSMLDKEEQKKKEEFHKQAEMTTLPHNLSPAQEPTPQTPSEEPPSPTIPEDK